jgi:acyl-CoA synthetase (AMP-forming)/AMP-acid ligase II
MNAPLIALLERSIKAHPNQRLHEGVRSISYAEFWSQAQKLSQQLLRGRKYGIDCASELNAAVGILACFMSDAIAVPLSKRYGDSHTNAIIESVKLSRKITDQNGSLQTKQFRADLSETDDLTNTAVILCTSGTTGKPKGVKLSGENLRSNVQAIQAYFQLTPDDNMLIVRSLFHASALTGEFLVALCAGANIHFFGNTQLPLLAADTIIKENITVLGTTPTLANLLCDAFRRRPSALRKLVLSGECLTQVVVEKLLATLPNTSFFNAYGLTEASPRVLVLTPEYFAQKPESVGRPIDGVEVKIVGGELWVRGANVMQGYYNNPDATAQKFANGWLHTGDIAEMDADGFLYIKGRADDMMIRAGMNIYPQALENALLAHPNIREALVQECDGKIVAKLVGDVSGRDIIAHCRTLLPSYAMPDELEFVTDLPKNATGKLVRR